MTQHRLRSIFAEGQPDWLQESAARALSADKVVMDASKTVTVSQLISAARGAGLIKADESESGSTRYARYLPFWA